MTAPFPFIVGCGRSGSTLLRVMLDAHPDMVVPPESYFLEQLIRRKDGFMSGDDFSSDAFIDELLCDPRFQVWTGHEHEVHHSLLADPPDHLAGALRQVYGVVAEQAGASRYADKTPGYALCVAELAAALPEAVFVHLIRDPRDVAASYRRANWGPRTLVSAAKMWTQRVGSAQRAGRALGPERYLELRYEELVADPRAALGAVCEFIDLRFDERMLSYEGGAAARETAQRDNGAHVGLLNRPTVGVRNWRDDMTAADAARVGAITDSMAAELGYAPSPRMTGTNRLRFFAEWVLSLGEGLSLRVRQTRAANRFRGTWRRLRGRSTREQLVASQP